jgi:hypothetical protein
MHDEEEALIHNQQFSPPAYGTVVFEDDGDDARRDSTTFFESP